MHPSAFNRFYGEDDSSNCNNRANNEQKPVPPLKVEEPCRSFGLRWRYRNWIRWRYHNWLRYRAFWFVHAFSRCPLATDNTPASRLDLLQIFVSAIRSTYEFVVDCSNTLASDNCTTRLRDAVAF